MTHETYPKLVEVVAKEVIETILATKNSKFIQDMNKILSRSPKYEANKSLWRFLYSEIRGLLNSTGNNLESGEFINSRILEQIIPNYIYIDRAKKRKVT